MTRSPRALAAATAFVLVATIVAACGATGSPSPSTAASPSPSGAAASSGPSPTPAASETPEPSVDRNGVPELEALLPDTIGGITLSKLSLTGEDFMALGTDTGRSQMDDMLAQLGKTVADLSIAEAHDPSGNPFKVGLFRVAGADPTQLLAVWVASQQAATQNRLKVSSTTVSDRDMTVLEDPTAEIGGTTYAFANGDTLWLIEADDQALVEETLTHVR